MSDPTSTASVVLRFWFDEVGRDRWFAKEAALDADKYLESLA